MPLADKAAARHAKEAAAADAAIAKLKAAKPPDAAAIAAAEGQRRMIQIRAMTPAERSKRMAEIDVLLANVDALKAERAALEAPVSSEYPKVIYKLDTPATPPPHGAIVSKTVLSAEEEEASGAGWVESSADLVPAPVVPKPVPPVPKPTPVPVE